MKTLISSCIFLLLLATSFTLDAQKTFKAVCDKNDGTVKIVDGEDRSPSLVPLKGGFPFYQVAENWVKENFPNGKCDPAAAAAQNMVAANAAAQTSNLAVQPTPGPTQTPPPVSSYGAPSGQPLLSTRVPEYRNTSMFISLLFSDFGKVYGIDPPLFPGVSIGIDQMIGTKFYGGTGIHFNTLIGETEDAAGVNAFYSFRIPLFAGYRMISGNRYWGVDLGLAANSMLRPLSSDSDLQGEIASDVSFNSMVRARFGTEKRAFELGVDLWINDILYSYEGYQMRMVSLGYRFYF
ncbi:MAG: hypothetical protein U5L72_00205 [Bacteroidales bacterium]|nr:hypothetical protein [Bacteroidales bacterium]